MTPVLYVAGAGRSGSTLLEMILGNLPDFFSIGEARYFWEYWHEADRLCGCGQPLQTCEFWSRVRARLAVDETQVAQMAQWANQYDRTRHLPLIAGRNGRFWPPLFVTATDALYRAIQAESGAKWIVDSSKVPSHLYLLTQIPNLDLRILHLVRDGRAVAYSWNKRQKKESGSQNQQTMPGKSLLKALIVWMIENWFAQLPAAQATYYTKLRYEDLVHAPATQLKQALSQLGWAGIDVTYLNEPSFFVHPTHSVGGNPLRFAHKEIHIRADRVWQEQMPLWQRVSLGLFALPMLRRYGYPIR